MSEKKLDYPHISLPIHKMKPHYDAVVIGSGYGGGIAASRMSRAGKRVALLEKGKERWPGEYPNSTTKWLKEIQYSSPKTHIGKKTGMYHIYNGSDQDAFVACGLGGTSLINGNVALEADDRVWQMSAWPDEIRKDLDSIKRGYERAGEMLEPCKYPTHFPELPKLKTLEAQAKLLGNNYHKNFRRVPITVTFENRVNAAGVRQRASTLSGNDGTGINDGSKNSTLMNYIPDAWNHGCEIFCECDVKRIKKCKKTGRYIIFYEWLDDERTKFTDDSSHGLFFVIADVVFLAAGTFGSNEILLRSKSYGLKISDLLGKGFSGNGNIIGLAYNTDHLVNGVGAKNDNSINMKVPVGPCITGIIDMRQDAENVLEGYVIEEGVIPAPARQVFQFVLEAGNVLTGIESKGLTHSESVQKKWREIKSIFGGAYTGAVSNTQTYLVMSHDDNTGQIELVDDRVKIEYKGVGTSDTVNRINKILEEATLKANGTYIPSPLWAKKFGRGLITVHPIGGCNMGKDGRDGVVNHKGQVFIGDGTDIHEGLYVCDGSIIPTALGVNPLFTISALSERICEYAAKDRGWKINYGLVTKPIDFNKPIVSYKQNEQDLIKSEKQREGGIAFTEVMRGYFSTEVLSTNYVAAVEQAKSADSAMHFLLTIIAYNTKTLVDMDDHSALITGTVSCRALSPDPLLVTRGKFRLFIPETDLVDSNRVMYNLYLTATDGTKYRLKGYKLLRNGTIKSAWKQTTKLYVTVYLCEVDETEDLDEMNVSQKDEEADTRKVVGRGILELKPFDFLKEMTTLRATGPTAESRKKAFSSFRNFFVKTLIKRTFVRFLPLQYPQAFPAAGRFYHKNRPKKEIIEVTAEDGVKCLVHRYQGGRKGPVLLVHGAGITHEMWSTNLVKHNFLDYLLENGYDVFLIDNRMSPTNPACYEQQSLDDIRLDQAAAVKKIREITGVEKIGIVAHCIGSVTTFIGLLDGKIEGVGSLIASQVAIHTIPGYWGYAKIHLRTIPIFRHLFRQNLFNVNTSPDTGLFNKIINQTLRFYPVPRNQMCRNALCHRVSLCYGLLYQHENLNQEIHDHQDEFFGTVNLTLIKHLTMTAKKKLVVNYQGKNVYATKENIRNRLNFPICFIHGGKNAVFDVKASRKSYDTFRSINGADNYTFHVINKYGHMDGWWGTNVDKDVFPIALKHLEDTQHLWGYAAQDKQRGFEDSD
ncbi:11911_t:CDS:2 [Funneliformis geosporum]|uniref:Cholesterol oxidase n=1 Tax=Funneliformis geosporum TaxID=1117311 RepID=A0A9W4SDR1_9GLOM|nr:4558_t:CDS:2 [Funneliformis geosporum]CAI2177912.1 11911_t:CDS:2 [Funneliformis geosporum]